MANPNPTPQPDAVALAREMVEKAAHLGMVVSRQQARLAALEEVLRRAKSAIEMLVLVDDEYLTEEEQKTIREQRCYCTDTNTDWGTLLCGYCAAEALLAELQAALSEEGGAG